MPLGDDHLRWAKLASGWCLQEGSTVVWTPTFSNWGRCWNYSGWNLPSSRSTRLFRAFFGSWRIRLLLAARVSSWWLTSKCSRWNRTQWTRWVEFYWFPPFWRYSLQSWTWTARSWTQWVSSCHWWAKFPTRSAFAQVLWRMANSWVWVFWWDDAQWLQFGHRGRTG